MFIGLHDLQLLLIKTLKRVILLIDTTPGLDPVIYKTALNLKKVREKTLKRDIAKNNQIKWSDLE